MAAVETGQRVLDEHVCEHRLGKEVLMVHESMGNRERNLWLERVNVSKVFRVWRRWSQPPF